MSKRLNVQTSKRLKEVRAGGYTKPAASEGPVNLAGTGQYRRLEQEAIQNQCEPGASKLGGHRTIQEVEEEEGRKKEGRKERRSRRIKSENHSQRLGKKSNRNKSKQNRQNEKLKQMT